MKKFWKGFCYTLRLIFTLDAEEFGMLVGAFFVIALLASVLTVLRLF